MVDMWVHKVKDEVTKEVRDMVGELNEGMVDVLTLVHCK